MASISQVQNGTTTYDVRALGVRYIAGTGTAAVTSSPYNYAKWDASASEITSYYDGLVIAYKVPVAGNGTYGTCLQINSLGYHPVVRAVNSMISTRYAVNATIFLVYNSSITGTVYANSASSSTISGCWVVINDTDNNTNTLLRTYASATNIEVPLIGSSSANSTTAAWSTYTSTYKDWYGAIPNDDAKRAKINLSTGVLTTGGNVIVNSASNGAVVLIDGSSTGSMYTGWGSGHMNHGVYSSGYAPTATEWTEDGKWMIYRDKNGSVTVNGNSTTATTASKLGSSNVGSARQPIYLNAGTATTANYTVAHFGNAGKSNMNDVGRLHASTGMTNLSDPSNTTDNPLNGTTKSTGWHLYWDASYTDDPNGTNAWVAQIANRAGTGQWWVRSRSGGTITNGTAWASGWQHLVVANQAGQGSSSLPVYIDSNGLVNSITELTVGNGSVWAGTNGDTTAERRVGVQSGAGQMYLYSQAATSGSRGLWLAAHGTGAAKAAFTIDTNNNVTFVGSLSGNATSATKATQDGNGATISSTYLKLSGGTMTGVLTLLANQYEDGYNGAMNCNNSDLYNVNSIYTADTADSAKEGIHFYRSSTTVDSLHANGGVLYFTPNRTLGQNGTSYKIYHAGNITRGTGAPSGGSNGDIYIQYK